MKEKGVYTADIGFSKSSESANSDIQLDQGQMRKESHKRHIEYEPLNANLGRFR